MSYQPQPRCIRDTSCNAVKHRYFSFCDVSWNLPPKTNSTYELRATVVIMTFKTTFSNVGIIFRYGKSHSLQAMYLRSQLKLCSIIIGYWDIHWSVHLMLKQAHTPLDIATCNKSAYLKVRKQCGSSMQVTCNTNSLLNIHQTSVKTSHISTFSILAY